MKTISVDLSGQLEPSALMIIYSGTQKEIYIESAAIRKMREGVFEPLPMVPLNKGQISALRNILDIHKESLLVERDVFPEEILFYDFNYGMRILCWYVKERKRTIVFQKGCGLGTFKTIIPPTVMYLYDDDLHVYSYKGKGRPTVGTPLMGAPYYNTSVLGAGKVCLGGNKIGDSINLKETIQKAEDIFFTAPFTHSTGTIYKNLDALWKKAKETGMFPEKELISLGSPLKKILLGSTIVRRT